MSDGFSDDPTLVERGPSEAALLVVHDDDAAAPPPAPSPFRAAALAHFLRPQRDGSLLRLTPEWTRLAWWILLGALVTAAVYVAVAPLHQYAAGPAVVRVDGRRDLTAQEPATVQRLLVRPGQQVRAGELLVELHGEAERADLERLQHEFELQLVKLLADPSDATAGGALTALRAERERAEARLQLRRVRADRDGVVSDVRVRPGQHLVPGDLLITLVAADAQLTLVALLPGSYRPLLHAGMPLGFTLPGWRSARAELVVADVSDEIVGPTEARRFLGSEIADAVMLGGPVVVVRAHLPASSFVADGQRYRYYDGLYGRAEARVRTRRMWRALLSLDDAEVADGR
ncbi:MAG: HlyD family efflux transporter periplasmic adaptor subunit [Polyangia bacterium]